MYMYMCYLYVTWAGGLYYWINIWIWTLTKFKLFLSNFIQLFTVTRASFWHISVVKCYQIISLYGLWKNTYMTIASVILKLFLSNFTHLFTITRATFWLRAITLLCVWIKFSPFMDFENQRCVRNIYTILTNLRKLAYKNTEQRRS